MSASMQLAQKMPFLAGGQISKWGEKGYDNMGILSLITKNEDRNVLKIAEKPIDKTGSVL